MRRQVKRRGVVSVKGRWKGERERWLTLLFAPKGNQLLGGRVSGWNWRSAVLLLLLGICRPSIELPERTGRYLNSPNSVNNIIMPLQLLLQVSQRRRSRFTEKVCCLARRP
jgi:hypothetical protein